MNAWDDLQMFLEPEETVDALVFGPWGWAGSGGNPGYGEPDPPPVPFDMRGKLLSPTEAIPLMGGWSFDGGFGAPECYAVTVWTDRRVIFVVQYDGATGLESVPRHPVDHTPDMPGG